MPPNREPPSPATPLPTSTASLKRLNDLEPARQPPRHRGHAPSSSRPAVNDDNRRPLRPNRIMVS